MKKTDSKPAKKSKVAPQYDAGRETRVLLEDINKNVKIVAEQHGSIMKKLEEHDQRFDKMESEIGIVKFDVEQLKSGQKKLELGQQEINQKLDIVTTDHERRIQRLEVVR